MALRPLPGAAARAASAPCTVGFLALPGFSLTTLAAPLEALAVANDALGGQAYRTPLLTLDGHPVAAACGTRLQAAAAWAERPPLQVLFVVSEGAADASVVAQLAGPLRALAGAGAVLGGLGTGAAVLAASGVLKDHRVTLHGAHAAALAEAHADLIVSARLYEMDRGRLSAASGIAALELVIAWLGQRHGERVLAGLLAHFGLERLRAGDEVQHTALAGGSGGNAKLAEAVALMQANLGEPLPTEDIARLVGVSRRQLERLFKQHLDELPSRYYADLRLQRARRLLQQTGQSILQIGLACGFSSGSHFSNAYRGRFGQTPREARSQRALAWRDATTPVTPDTEPSAPGSPA